MRLSALSTAVAERAGVLCCVLFMVISAQALAQTSATDNPSPTAAQPSAPAQEKPAAKPEESASGGATAPRPSFRRDASASQALFDRVCVKLVLNKEATRDRIRFLAGQLSFKPPATKAITAIPVLVQPPWPRPSQ